MDDMILAGKNEAKLKSVKDELSSKFDIKDLGKLSYFLGMSIICNQEEKKTWMGQPAYTEKLLTKMAMSDCRPVTTPIESGNHLVKASEDDEPLDQQSYQSLIGSLMYLATWTLHLPWELWPGSRASLTQCIGREQSGYCSTCEVLQILALCFEVMTWVDQ